MSATLLVIHLIITLAMIVLVLAWSILIGFLITFLLENHQKLVWCSPGQF